MTVRSTLFEFWQRKEMERGERISVAEVARATGIQRNTIQSLLDDKPTRFDGKVLSALCQYFDVPTGAIPFLVYEQSHST